MTFLPIVDRELRVAARRRSTYLVRIGAATLGILIFGGLQLTQSFRGGMFFPGGQAQFFVLKWLEAVRTGAMELVLVAPVNRPQIVRCICWSRRKLLTRFRDTVARDGPLFASRPPPLQSAPKPPLIARATTP